MRKRSLKVQVPSNTDPSRHYLVHRRTLECNCSGYDFRGRCTHSDRVKQHPYRYTPEGEDRTGLWSIGAATLAPSDMEDLFDLHRIRVVKPHRPLKIPAWRAVDLEAWCAERGLILMELGSAERAAQHYRVCILLPGQHPFMELK